MITFGPGDVRRRFRPPSRKAVAPFVVEYDARSSGNSALSESFPGVKNLFKWSARTTLSPLASITTSKIAISFVHLRRLRFDCFEIARVLC